MKRDLKADLEELHSLMQSADDWENMQNFIRAFGDEWLNQALAEKERADRSEALVRELVDTLNLAQESLHENGIGIVDDRQVMKRAKEVLGMMKRDLKADLEELESLKENDVHFWRWSNG